jgi:diacylglycerol O-acyltransferase / wax synthase
MRASERLSGVDRAWLLMDRPTNLMTIVGLIILGGALERARWRALVAERFLAFERFRCYPAGDVLAATWVPAAHFNIDDHLSIVSLPARAGKRELETLVGELAGTAFNPTRPLWSMHLVENYQGGSAIVIRIHHCYADGIALMRVLLSLADGARDAQRPVARTPASATPAPEAAPGDGDAHGGLVSSVLLGAVREGFDFFEKSTMLLERGLYYALHPAQASTAALEALGFASELAHLGTLADDPPTSLKRALSGVRRVAWADPIVLEEVRTISQVLGCTINDVLVATLAGALGRYLEAQGDEVSGLTIRAAVPVDLRSGDDSEPLMGNRFGMVFVELPIGIRHPLERLYTVHAAMQRLKSSGQALAVLALMSLIGSLPSPVEPPALALFSAKASLVASNLPGPREPLTLGGVPMSQVLFWVPQAGSIGTGVSMLSYNGRVQFGVISDRLLIPEPARLVEQVGAEFDRLVLLVLLGGVALQG